MLTHESAAVDPAPRWRRWSELRCCAQHEPGLDAMCGDERDNLRTSQCHAMNIRETNIDRIHVVVVEKPCHQRVMWVVSDVHAVIGCTFHTTPHNLRIDT